MSRHVGGDLPDAPVPPLEDDLDVREAAVVLQPRQFATEAQMEITPPIREPGHVVETVALRGLAVLLAPVVFVTTFLVALASIPAVGLRWALSRS